MDEKAITECWKCKLKYYFTKDASGLTQVTCPQCGSKAKVRSEISQIVQKPKNMKQGAGFGIWNILVLVLGIALVISVVFAVSAQMSVSSVQNDLTSTRNTLLTTQDSLSLKWTELNTTNANLVASQATVNSLENQIDTKDALIQTQNTQIQTKNNEIQTKSTEINNTNSFIKNYFKVNGFYYQGLNNETNATAMYNTSELFFNANDWINASPKYNITKITFVNAKNKYDSCILLCQNSTNLTSNVSYKNLTTKWYNLTSSCSKKTDYIISAINYYVSACQYYNNGNMTEGNQSVENATLKIALYNAEKTNCTTYFSQIELMLAEQF